MDYLHALNTIARPIRAADFPRSLQPLHQLLAVLNYPQKACPAVVVAGSVGKGTIAHQVASLLNSSQSVVPRVGLYTSPHLHIFRERFAINGTLISQQTFAEAMTTIQTAVARTPHRYSTFELATALALWWFREEKVDIAIMEIGIGGRDDAVNVVPNQLALITPIEREHAVMLGGTLSSIAAHKAGIIQPEGFALSAPQSTEVTAVLQQEAAARHAHLTILPAEELALAAGSNLIERRIIPSFSLPESILPVHLPGRMEQITLNGKTILIDGAHTHRSAQRLRRTIDQRWPEQPIRIIIGILKDKPLTELITTFDHPRFRLVLTQTSGHRALPADQFTQPLHLDSSSLTIDPDMNHALLTAVESAEEVIIATGSLRTAAVAREVYGLLTPDEYIESQQTRAIFEGSNYLARL